MADKVIAGCGISVYLDQEQHKPEDAEECRNSKLVPQGDSHSKQPVQFNCLYRRRGEKAKKQESQNSYSYHSIQHDRLEVHTGNEQCHTFSFLPLSKCKLLPPKFIEVNICYIFHGTKCSLDYFAEVDLKRPPSSHEIQAVLRFTNESVFKSIL